MIIYVFIIQSVVYIKLIMQEMIAIQRRLLCLHSNLHTVNAPKFGLNISSYIFCLCSTLGLFTVYLALSTYQRNNKFKEAFFVSPEETVLIDKINRRSRFVETVFNLFYYHIA